MTYLLLKPYMVDLLTMNALKSLVVYVIHGCDHTLLISSTLDPVLASFLAIPLVNQLISVTSPSLNGCLFLVMSSSASQSFPSRVTLTITSVLARLPVRAHLLQSSIPAPQNSLLLLIILHPVDRTQKLIFNRLTLVTLSFTLILPLCYPPLLPSHHT